MMMDISISSILWKQQDVHYSMSAVTTITQPAGKEVNQLVRRSHSWQGGHTASKEVKVTPMNLYRLFKYGYNVMK